MLIVLEAVAVALLPIIADEDTEVPRPASLLWLEVPRPVEGAQVPVGTVTVTTD